MTKSNGAEGRLSYDSAPGNTLVEFFNRSVSPYPTEVGGPKFDLVPVAKQKDIMINVARLHAKQEYRRIMELVEVLQRQAQEVEKRLDITDMVHGARYDFQIYHNQFYWLVYDHLRQGTILTQTGNNQWSSGAPEHYEYICRIQWLGDYTWREVGEDE